MKLSRHEAALGQLPVAIVVVLILVSGFTGYLVGIRGPSELPANSSTIISTSTKTTTTTISAIALQTNTTHVTESETVTSTSYQTTSTLTVTANNSISNIALANITTGEYPQQIAMNPNTNRIYVTFWNGTSFLVVIDDTTNKIIATLAIDSNSAPLVDSSTNLIFVGNEIINGSTDKQIGSINSNLTFAALDQNSHIVYAYRQYLVGAMNGATMIYEINGTTFEIINSENYTGQMLGDFVFDSNTRTIFATDCTESFACSPSYIVSINGSTLAMESKLEANTIFFAAAFDPQTNMVLVTALQNLLLVVNGSNGELVAKVPVTAYADELEGITIDTATNEILLSGEPYCSGFVECNSNTIYVLSATNYGEFADFVGNNTESGPVILQFDPANNETYMGFGFSSFVLATKIPQYNTTMLVP